MKKYFILLIALFLLNGCSGNLPIYKWDKSFDTVKIDGKEYSRDKLSYNGKTYRSEPEQDFNPNYYNKLDIGKKIGRVDGNFDIYQVKNDKNRVVLQGFMFPAIYFKLDSSS